MHNGATALRPEMWDQATAEFVKACHLGMDVLVPQFVGKFRNMQLVRHTRSGKHQGVDAPMLGNSVGNHALYALQIGGVELVYAGCAALGSYPLRHSLACGLILDTVTRGRCAGKKPPNDETYVVAYLPPLTLRAAADTSRP